MATKKKTETKESSKKGSWFLTGQQGVAKSRQEDEANKQRRAQRKDMPWRFRLNSNEENVKAIMLDTPKFFFREHNLKIGGTFGNYFTCLQDFDTCPLCSIGNSSYVVAGTIIDPREWTDNKNVVHKDQKRLVVFKSKAREKIVRMIEDKKDLQYCVLKFSRGSTQTEASTGEDIEFVKRLTRDQLKAVIPKGETMKWLEPYDYEKLFEPKSPEELRRLVGQSPPVGSAEESTGEDEEKAGKGSKEIESIEDLL